MALKLRGSTSGFVGLDAPSVAGNNTLILPENSGSAFQIFANDITAGVTTFTSVTVNRNGDLTVPGTISIGGTLTYEDVTSVDSVGVVTARGLSIFGNTSGLNVASGISTFVDISARNITGAAVTFSGIAEAVQFKLGDNAKALYGDSGDLQIYHSTNSLIQNGTGALQIITTTGNLFLRGQDNITFNTAGNNERLRINSSGLVAIGTATARAQFDVIKATGNVIALFEGSNASQNHRVRIDASGASSTSALAISNSNSNNQTSLYHSGGNNNLVIMGGQTAGSEPTSGTTRAVFATATELYHNGSKKIETQSAGVEITGKLTFATEGLAGGSIDLGIDADLNLYHDNSDAYFDNNKGDFYIRNDGNSTTEKVRIQAKGGEQSIICSPNGAVELYEDNTLRLATFTEGVDIHVSGNSGLRIRGNVANVDPRITFRRKNNDGNNSEAAAIVMAYQGGTTHESGHLDFYTNGDSNSAALNRRVRIRNDGQILINTTTLTSLGSQTGANNVVTVNKSGICLTAYGVVAGFYYDRINYTNSQYYVVNSSGTGVYLGNGSTSWSANSDERLKINIAELDGTKAYNHVKTARATSFNWNATGHPTDKKIGFIAQDWETNYPEVVSTSTDTVDSVENPKGIRYTETVPVLMAALKEAITKIETLETKVAALEGS